MKMGYSLLLGEYVPAEQIRYGDVSGFQIVCPCCKDPVIKVERATATDVAEFLSHYASKPGVGECELRVASISSETRTATNNQSRGQSLKMFMSVLRDAMNLEKSDRGLVERARKLGFVARFTDSLADFFAKGGWPYEVELEPLLDTIAKSIDAERTFADTGLSMSFRRRLAADLVRHLRSPHAEKTRKFVADFALTRVLAKHWGANVENLEPTDAAVAIAKHIAIEDGGRKAFAWLADATSEKHPAVDQYIDFLDITAIEFLQTLMRLPALAMLANHRAGRHPLAGIDQLDQFVFTSDSRKFREALHHSSDTAEAESEDTPKFR